MSLSTSSNRPTPARASDVAIFDPRDPRANYADPSLREFGQLDPRPRTIHRAVYRLVYTDIVTTGTVVHEKKTLVSSLKHTKTNWTLLAAGIDFQQGLSADRPC